MIPSRLEGVFIQLKDLYAEQCDEEIPYKFSLAADSAKGPMTAKTHMRPSFQGAYFSARLVLLKSGAGVDDVRGISVPLGYTPRYS